jgi:rubredoxin
VRRYRCFYCNHVYDEAQGDPDSGLAPGTRWDDVPADWCCPVCGAAKADYALVED